ncbi:MAG: hypothetical protein IPH09_13390 [bacterium]|nr:hypothetical protein [bacterium]
MVHQGGGGDLPGQLHGGRVQARGRAAERVGQREVPAEELTGLQLVEVLAHAGAHLVLGRHLHLPAAPAEGRGGGGDTRARQDRVAAVAQLGEDDGSSGAGLAPALFEALHQVGELRAVLVGPPGPAGVRASGQVFGGAMVVGPGVIQVRLGQHPAREVEVGRRRQGQAGEAAGVPQQVQRQQQPRGVQGHVRGGQAQALEVEADGPRDGGRLRRQRVPRGAHPRAGGGQPSQMMIHGAGASRDHACGGRGFSSSRVDRRARP